MAVIRFLRCQSNSIHIFNKISFILGARNHEIAVILVHKMTFLANFPKKQENICKKGSDFESYLKNVLKIWRKVPKPLLDLHQNCQKWEKNSKNGCYSPAFSSLQLLWMILYSVIISLLWANSWFFITL